METTVDPRSRDRRLDSGTPRRSIAVVNVSGPYGVGKDSVLSAIRSALGTKAHRVATITTRPVSSDFDPSYTSLKSDEFDAAVSNGRWLVNSQIDGAVRYATSIDEILAAADQGKVAVHSIFAGPAGAGRLREVFGSRLLSFGLLATASGGLAEELAELDRRLKARGREDTRVISSRLAHQREKIDYVRTNPVVNTPDGPLRAFDYVVINQDLATARAEALRYVAELTEF